MKEKEILEAKAKIEEGIRLINEAVVGGEIGLDITLDSFLNEQGKHVLYLKHFEIT